MQTKLCIRDGLYRLARSAQHRQVFPNMMNNNGDSQDVKDLQNAETSHKYVVPNKDLIYTYTSMNQYGFENCNCWHFPHCLIRNFRVLSKGS